MNREIRFRAWDLDKEKMAEFDIIDLWNGVFNGSQFLQIGLVQVRENCDDIILMQFTGLKDKNGKEIYEGDIVKTIFDEATEDMPEQSTIHTVEWGIEYSYPAFDLIPIKGDDERVSDEVNGFSYCLESGIDLEVIGNIYENPELLKP